MVTKEIIKSEINKVPEERLEELYEVVKIYSRTDFARKMVRPVRAKQKPDR
jgi:hypothetical protein